MRLERTYEAEAAHQLSAGVPDGHPCKRLHGHRYIFTVTIIGDVDLDSVKDVASYVTPTPGGVGPVTVAMLLRNVLTVAKNHKTQ